jgi:hypothetical protein
MKRPRVTVCEALEMATTDELLSALSSRTHYMVCYRIPHVTKDPPRLTIGGTLLPGDLPKIIAAAYMAKSTIQDYFDFQVGSKAMLYMDDPLNSDDDE